MVIRIARNVSSERKKIFNRIKIINLPTDCDPYRPSTFHVDFDNNITMCFNYHDVQAQEEFLIENYNKRNKQGVLFL